MNGDSYTEECRGDRASFTGRFVKVAANLPSAAPGSPEEVTRGVYLSVTDTLGKQVSKGVSTTEARAAGEALIKLADQIDADAAKRIPEEPAMDSWLVIIHFPGKVPVTRYGPAKRWKFATTSETYSWEELCKHVGPNRAKDFAVIYDVRRDAR